MSQLANIFQVRLCGHPVDRSPENVLVHNVICRRQTVSQIVEDFCNSSDVCVVYNGELVPKEEWGKKRAKRGVCVDIIPQVGFLFFWASAALFWKTVGAVIVNLALAFAFSYLGGKLFGTDLKESEDEGTQNYSWTPKTTHKEGGVRPRLLGERMVHGNIIASWTDVISDNEVLYAIVDHGEGPIEGLGANIVYINDQPSGNYDGVTVQERLGTMNQTCMTGFEKTKIEYTLAWDITAAGGPLTFTTPNDWIDDLEFTISFPGGLIKYHKDGESTSYGVNIKAEVSERGLDSWTTVYDTTISAETRRPFYKNIKLSELASPYSFQHDKQYDIRFTRITGADDERRSSATQIKSVREVINTAFTYPGRALIGVTAVGTDQLSGSIDIKCVRKGRIVNVYDGAEWNLEYSNNLAWCVLDCITLPVLSGSNDSGDPYTIERYEGLDPANIDLAFFYEWALLCDTQVADGKGGLESLFICNYNWDQKRSLYTLIYELAQVGRCKLYWEGSILTGWLDAEVDEATDLVTMDNIMAKSWKNSWTPKDEMAGTVGAFYDDEDRGYERTPYLHSNQYSGQYKNIVSLETVCDTRRSGSVRMADFALLKNQLVRNVNSFEQHKDALRHKLGDVIRLQAKTPNWGQSYRVQSVDSGLQTITLDRSVSGVSEDDLLYVRSFDESSGIDDVTVSVYTVDSVSGSSVTIKETFSPTPSRLDIVAIGTSTSAPVLRRIVKIIQKVDNFYEITVETYDADLYSGITPTNPSPNYVWPAPAKNNGINNKPITWENILDTINAVTPPQPNTDIPVISNCTFTYDSGKTTVYWNPTDPTDDILFRYRGVTYAITAGSSDKVWLYWDPNYTDQFRETDLTTEAIADGNWPVHIMNDGYASQAVGIRLLHAGLILAGTIRAEQYAELRQTMSWMDGDSCDASHSYTFDFKLPSELTAIVSVKLSFKIKPFRAYSTAASTVGSTASTSGVQNTWPWETTNGVHETSVSGTTDSATGTSGNTNVQVPQTEIHIPSYTDYEYGPGNHRHSTGYSGDWYMPATYTGNHSHSIGSHDHDFDLPDHTHDLTIPDHTHNVTVPSHSHSLTFGIYEESNATNVHYHIDNGSGFGAASSSYNSDQIDIDITSSITTAGWKSIRFDVDARCRITAILEAKVDITA